MIHSIKQRSEKQAPFALKKHRSRKLRKNARPGQGAIDFFCKVCLTFNAKRTILLLQSILCKSTEGVKMKTRIRELRKARKLSQEELALAVGTTRQTITSIEVGKYTASLVLAYKIARYFDLTIESVFDFSEVNE